MGTTSITIDQQKLENLKAAMPKMVQMASSFIIGSNEDYEASQALLDNYGVEEAQAIAFFAPSKKAASDLHKMICDMERQVVGPRSQCVEIMKNKRKVWRATIEELDRQLKARAEAEARRVREAEIAAEQSRIAAENAEREKARQAQEAELKRQAAELKAAGDKKAAQVLAEQAKQIAEENEKQKVADAELARVQIEEARSAPLPVYAPPVSEAPSGGKGVRKTYKAVIKNPDLIPQPMLLPAEDKLYEVSQPHYAKIRSIVKALGTSHGIPGIEAVPEETESVRRK